MQKNRVSDIWLKASVVGSLWATVEIVVGSFFHNMRLPMAGTLLAMISVVIMVSFHQRWKEKGLFWRAGLICALMKSISPSAILLGPMTGILTEAFLMEMVVRMFGANLLGYLLGGAVALVSTIAHKVVNMLIIYGFDLVNVLVNLYGYAVEKIGYPDLEPEIALWVLLGIYALLGMIASAAGVYVGKKPALISSGKMKLNDDEQNAKNDFFQIDPTQQFSVKLLFFHLFAILASLVLVSSYSLALGSLFIVVYVVFAVIYYKRALRHLKRPFFWFQVVVLTFLATVFYNGFKAGDLFNQEGLLAGLQMNIRAVLILVGFSALSVELRNPVIRSVLIKRGFSQLYLSLGMAFSVLPWIIRNAPKPRLILRKPVASISLMMSYADNLLEIFRQKNRQPRVIIITGEKHEGKTTFTGKVTNILKANGKSVGGFLAIGSFEDNRRSEFKLKSLVDGEEKPLCSIHFESGQQAGPFRFSEEGLQFGNELLSSGSVAGNDVVVIDEIGPFELKGQGWSDAIRELMQSSEALLIWVVRKSLVEEVISRWELTRPAIFDIGKSEPEDVAKNILHPTWTSQNQKSSYI